jgi:Tfp pilus assembly protein PilO
MDQRMRRLGLALHVGGLLMVIASVCLVQCLIYQPLASARAEGLERSVQLDALLGGSRQIRLGHEKLKQSLAEAREREAALLSRIPEAPREAEFLAHLSGLANEVKLRLRDYRPGETRAKGDHWEMEIGIACEGSYESICRFLDGLTSLPRLTNLSRLEINTQEDSDVYPALLKLVIYFGARPSAADHAEESAHG